MTTFIQYLEIFGLTVFGLFFLALLVLTIYVFYFIRFVRKSAETLISELLKLVSYIDDETQTISGIIKSKLNSIDISKILFGSTILGGIISGIRNMNRKSRSSKKSKETK